MSGLIATITQIGKQRAFDAQTQGIKISIKYLATGTGSYTPSEAQTALRNEVERVAILSSEINSTEQTITVYAILQSPREYWVNEVGFYLDDGTLFAVWSHPTFKLGYKSLLNKFLLGFKIKLVNVPINSVQIIDAGLDLRLFFSEEFVKIGDAIANFGVAIVDLKFDLMEEVRQRKEADSSIENSLSVERIARQVGDNQLLELIISNVNAIAMLGDSIAYLAFKQ